MTADTAPAWDGLPDKPKRPIFHWLTTDEFAVEPIPVRWQPGLHSWRIGAAQDDNGTPEQIVAAGYVYLGPCLMPYEVAAQIEAARREEREAIARDVDCGCDERGSVLAEKNIRIARTRCLNRHSLCCAIQAAAIRARSTEEQA